MRKGSSWIWPLSYMEAVPDAGEWGAFGTLGLSTSAPPWTRNAVSVAFSIRTPSVRNSQQCWSNRLKGNVSVTYGNLHSLMVPYATTLNRFWVGWDAIWLIRTKWVHKCHAGLFIQGMASYAILLANFISLFSVMSEVSGLLKCDP